MAKIWICLILLCLGASFAQNFDEIADFVDGSDYNQGENLLKEDAASSEDKQLNEDYQIEDNRSAVKEEENNSADLAEDDTLGVNEQVDENIIADEYEEPMESAGFSDEIFDDVISEDEISKEALLNQDENVPHSSQEANELLEEVLSPNENGEDTFDEETKEILAEEENIEEDDKEIDVNDGSKAVDQEIPADETNDAIDEEAKQILDDTNNNLDDNSNEEQNLESKSDVEQEESNVETVEEINDDLDGNKDIGNEQAPESNENTDNEEQIPEADDNLDEEDITAENTKEIQVDENNSDGQLNNDALSIDDAFVEEAKNILAESDEPEEEIKDKIDEETEKILAKLENYSGDDIRDQIDQETKKIIADLNKSGENLSKEADDLQKESDTDPENNEKFVQEAANDVQQILDEAAPNSDDDAVVDTHNVNHELETLMETWIKLADDEDKHHPDDSIADYEDKYGRPYKEGVLLAQRDDYDDKENDKDEEYGDINGDELTNESNEGVYNDLDEQEQKVFEEFMAKINLSNDEDSNDETVAEDNSADEKLTEEVQANQDTESANVQQADTPTETTTTAEGTIKPIDVSELTPQQYDDLMHQFRVAHADELEEEVEGFSENVAVIHIPLSLDEAVEITSPNYPMAYPTNNVVDWMLEGDGVGIEFNVTDFMINGVMGHYLLVKPGGVDESGTDGLIFSYRLNEPRRYRFLDVNRMFIRFSAPRGMPARGFRLSAKLISPPIQMEEESPDAEPSMPIPREVLTLHLARTPQQFREVEEEFRVVLADMATMFLNANEMDFGLNTTLEVTQITRVAPCNVAWPDFENCVTISVAVPLVFDEEDEDDDPRLSQEELETMWRSLSVVDPFAERLRRMEVSEFSSPDDGSVLAAWLVISLGAVVSVAVLAFGLWRYSCFENYTRMPQFSDQDSVYNEKRALDLYPTPHQTLPPLYGDERWESKFEDTARVDMGGYTNRSFTRDAMYDIESDDEVVSTRDRYTTDV